MAIRFNETPDRNIANFTEAKIVDELQIQEIYKELLVNCQRAAETSKKMVIDFRGVRFISSAMLSKLVQVQGFAKQKSLDLRLSNLGEELLEVLKITRLHRLFRIESDDGPAKLGAPTQLENLPSKDSGSKEPPKPIT